MLKRSNNGTQHGVRGRGKGGGGDRGDRGGNRDTRRKLEDGKQQQERERDGRGRAPAPPNLALGDRTRVKTLAATQSGTKICPDWNLGKCKAGKCPKGLHACNGMVKGVH